MSAVPLNLDGLHIILSHGKRSGCKAWIKIRHSDGIVTSSTDDHLSCARLSCFSITVLYSQMMGTFRPC